MLTLASGPLAPHRPVSLARAPRGVVGAAKKGGAEPHHPDILLRADHYDAEVAAAYFAARPWGTYSRLLQVGGAVARVAVGIGCFSRATDEDQAGVAKAVTAELGRLGPSFIKLAQTASTRRDLLGDVVCDALGGMRSAGSQALLQLPQPHDCTQWDTRLLPHRIYTVGPWAVGHSTLYSRRRTTQSRLAGGITLCRFSAGGERQRPRTAELSPEVVLTLGEESLAFPTDSTHTHLGCAPVCFS